MSLGKERPYTFSKFNLLNTDNLLLFARQTVTYRASVVSFSISKSVAQLVLSQSVRRLIITIIIIQVFIVF